MYNPRDAFLALLFWLSVALLSVLCAFGCASPEPAPPSIVLSTTSSAPSEGHLFLFKNSCSQTLWVGSAGQNGSAPLLDGGWRLDPNVVQEVTVPVGHSGRVWPRTECAFAEDGTCTGAGNCCVTGGCLTASNVFGLACAQTGVPPASLVEWTLDATSGNGPIDYYDMSLVDGWSVPVSMRPIPDTYNPTPDPGIGAWWCEPAGCTEGEPVCPDAYKVEGAPGACWSPCQAATRAGSADATKLCCTCSLTDPITCPEANCAGGYGCTPYHDPEYPADMVCNPWNTDTARAWDATAQSYIANVKAACPKAYSWQFDDVKATFNCRKTGGLVGYIVEFCPDVPATP